jgi:hypothetical protein
MVRNVAAADARAPAQIRATPAALAAVALSPAWLVAVLDMLVEHFSDDIRKFDLPV